MFGFGKKAVEEEPKEDVTVARARACLSREEFKAYREAYEREEAEIVGTLINDAGTFVLGNSGTMETFGAKCLVRLNRLRDVRSLLVKVTIDERRGGK